MDTNSHELILKDDVFAVVGAAIEVITGLKVGLILNFRLTKLEWKRCVL